MLKALFFFEAKTQKENCRRCDFVVFSHVHFPWWWSCTVYYKSFLNITTNIPESAELAFVWCEVTEWNTAQSSRKAFCGRNTHDSSLAMITGAQETTVSIGISINVSNELTNDVLSLFDWQALLHQVDNLLMHRRVSKCSTKHCEAVTEQQMICSS